MQLPFDFCMIEAKPDNLIGDRAYNSDKLDAAMRAKGTEMISPHRSNRVRKKTQDGRRLRRYERRWIVERFLVWLQPTGLLMARLMVYSVNFPSALRSLSPCASFHANRALDSNRQPHLSAQTDV
jgi:transposase